MIAIIEGCGSNIASIQFALERLGKQSLLTKDPDVIVSASHVILPGVGTANYSMSQLIEYRLVDVIRSLQQPVLGICLGMQLLFQSCAEGDVDCLGLIPGTIQHLPKTIGLTMPHMGWNQLKIKQGQSKLFTGIDENNYVYFVHSYAAPINAYTIATTEHGIAFASAVQKDNFYGVQFHPERSGKIGANIIQKFIELS